MHVIIYFYIYVSIAKSGSEGGGEGASGPGELLEHTHILHLIQ